jgi:hypothetical protein
MHPALLQLYSLLFNQLPNPHSILLFVRHSYLHCNLLSYLPNYLHSCLPNFRPTVHL